MLTDLSSSQALLLIVVHSHGGGGRGTKERVNLFQWLSSRARPPKRRGPSSPIATALSLENHYANPPRARVALFSL